MVPHGAELCERHQAVAAAVVVGDAHRHDFDAAATAREPVHRVAFGRLPRTNLEIPNKITRDLKIMQKR